MTNIQFGLMERHGIMMHAGGLTYSFGEWLYKVMESQRSYIELSSIWLYVSAACFHNPV